MRLKVWWLWFVLAPLAVSLCGYFPGRRLRKVGDLPKPARNTESIHGIYINAPRIGHFGFFRSAYEASLWRAHLLPELS